MMTEFTELKAYAERMEAQLAEMKVMMQTMAEQSTAPKSKGKSKSKKVKAESEGEAEPKDKRPPSAWILFSVRVQKLLRPAEEALDKAERTSVGTMNQFAGTLWSQT